MNHDQLKELLPLEAIGLLEGEEARALAAHRADGCDECEAEVRGFRETLAAMALSAAGEAPADRIWERLERRLDTVAADLPATSERAGGRGAAIAARRGELRRWRVSAAIAAGVALLMTVVADRSARQLVATRTAADAQIAALANRTRARDVQLIERDQELTSLRDQLATVSQMTRAVLAPDFHMIKLQPMPPAPDAAGLVAMSASRGRCVVEVAGLPMPPPAKTYELWWIGSKSGPVRAALFNPGPHGGATVAPGMPPAGETILASAVTLEPAGGMDKPTGAMYLKGAP
ncbi:MAG: anti-sigma factor domain-containing protein [Candidatus Binataceae bacterium]